jgi:TonB-linked SusC/RagA family outer membrane protein
MLLSIFLFLPTTLKAQSYSVDYQQKSIEQVISDLKKLTGYEFVYQKQAVQDVPSITCKCSCNTVANLLERVLEGTGLSFEVVGKTVILKGQSYGNKHEVKLSGTMVDEAGYPLPYASIKLKGTSMGTTTDNDGNFSLVVNADRKQQVEFSYIGFVSQTRSVASLLKSKHVKIVMHEDKSQLDEVVVTGYQVLNKRSLTSAVSTAKMEDLARTDVSSLDQMLEGKIPDLMVTNNSGEIGVAPKIRIRGTSTLIGNREPLWVVDGIVVKDPVNISPEELNDPDYVNRIGNAIAGINPQDIERIDVLKDAAATAIYGTKAANGVIVVTTKRGYEGKPQVSYNFSTNFKIRPRYTDRSVDVMDSKERIQFSRELYQSHYVYPSDMTTVGYEDALLKLYNGEYNYNQFVSAVGAYETQNTDWFKLLCQDAWSSQHTASISGGSKKTRYYASMGYNKDNDVIKANSNERYTWSMNLDNTFSKLLTASFTFNGYNYKRNYYQDEVAPLNYAYTTSRCIPAYDADGQYYYYKKKNSSYTEYNYNILNELENSYKKQKVNSMTFTTNLQFTFTDWLRANAILSITHQNTNIEGWWGERSFHIAALRGSDFGSSETNYDTNTCPQGGELSETDISDRNYTARFQLDCNKYFGPDDMHNIDATFGVEISSDKYKEHSSTARGYFRDRGETFVSDIDPTKYTAYASWLASNVPSVTDNLTNTASAYLSVTYAYKTLWRVNLNGRVDGSNKFGDRSNDKFLPIWSLSGSYDVGHWLKAKWIDYITAKASYGFQGNMLDTENPLLTIKKGAMSSYYNEYISTVEHLPNPNLKWEKTSSYNFGLDMSFFDHRLQMEFSAYYKKTRDAFMNKNVNSVNGVTSYVINGGDVTNKGYSFDITATPIRTKDFRWTLSTSISKVINSIDSRPDAQTYELEDFLDGSALVKGESVNTFYSYKFIGLSPVDGGPLFDDYYDNREVLRGLSKYDTYTTVLEASGKRDADIQGSLTNTFRYKNWHASFNLGYSLGAKTRLFAMFGSAASGGAYGYNIYSEKNYSRDYMDRWQKPGDEQHTNIPAIISSSSDAYYKYSRVWTDFSGMDDFQEIADNYWDMYDYSNVRVVSADYLKLQSVSVTYELPYKTLDKIGLERLAFTVSAYNLFTICDSALKGQTPTQGGFSTIQLSDRPSFSFGMNIIF